MDGVGYSSWCMLIFTAEGIKGIDDPCVGIFETWAPAVLLASSIHETQGKSVIKSNVGLM